LCFEFNFPGDTCSLDPAMGSVHSAANSLHHGKVLLESPTKAPALSFLGTVDGSVVDTALRRRHHFTPVERVIIFIRAGRYISRAISPPQARVFGDAPEKSGRSFPVRRCHRAV
jgi:hypothetical protein